MQLDPDRMLAAIGWTRASAVCLFCWGPGGNEEISNDVASDLVGTARDRNAEVIRTVLRKAGRREFSERHGEFVVEGGGYGRSFHVACADEPEASAQELARYTDDLSKAGCRVEPDADDDQVPLVHESS